jgi:hypothetical protein
MRVRVDALPAGFDALPAGFGALAAGFGAYDLKTAPSGITWPAIPSRTCWKIRTIAKNKRERTPQYLT